MLRDEPLVPVDEVNNPISVRLRPEFRAALREVATRRGVNLSTLLRDAAGAILCVEQMCTCPACPSRRALYAGGPGLAVDPMDGGPGSVAAQLPRRGSVADPPRPPGLNLGTGSTRQ